jgi:two-component system response regulator AtoC
VFLKEFNSLHGRSVKITAAALNCLKQYDFPGNARELRNLMERASVLSQGPEITPADLPTDINRQTSREESDFNLSERVAGVERNCIRKALLHSGGNRTEAARLLGISRKNLWEKMKNYEIE